MKARLNFNATGGSGFDFLTLLFLPIAVPSILLQTLKSFFSFVEIIFVYLITHVQCILHHMYKYIFMYFIAKNVDQHWPQTAS
jgi:hypothetical protein